MIAFRLSGFAGAIITLVLGLATVGLAQSQQRQAQAAAATTTVATPAGGLSGSLDTVSAAQIAATAATDVRPSLALVPTLVFDDHDGLAGLAALSLRGSTPQQVLVLLDGQRLADTQSASFNFNDLAVPVERIERLEVLPSPVSVSFGADALGGVVNVVTRPPGLTPGFSLSYGRGADAEQRIAGGVQYGVGNIGLRLDGRLHTGDGYRNNGDFDVKSYAAGFAVAPAPWGVDVRWDSFEREAGVPGPVSLPSPHARRSDNRTRLRADFTYQPGSVWNVKTTVFSQSQSQEYTDPDPPETAQTEVLPTSADVEAVDSQEATVSAAASPELPASAAPIASNGEGRSQGFAARWEFATGRGEIFTLGGEWITDRVEGSSDGDHDADRWAVFAQDQWQAGNWSAVGAIRSDTHSVYGQRTTPSLSIGWAAGGWRLWSGWARGFRLPSYDELYRNERFLQGDPDLEPETSEGFDGGVELGGTGGRLRFGAFVRNVSNLIRWADADGDLVQRPGNVSQVRIVGYETELLYRPSSTLAIPVGCQFLSVEDQDTGERVPGSVRSLWRAAIQSTGGSFSWSLEYTVTDRGEYQLRDGAWNYALLNAALTWRESLGSVPVQISLRGENLQDRNYEAVEGYPQRGRSWFAEVKFGL